ncbi:efflux RND transporter periplasmic adaptor subunit [Candidatus Uhrbacteria bacterium]|nr:efflux RND transporter periplasmic adaptor subunit [Candidatus Uhrbacteria bacterium]
MLGMASKRWVLLVAALAVAGGGWVWRRSNSSADIGPQYVLATVEKGSVVVSISGSGQVSASNQVDVKPTVGGTIRSLPIKQGASVGAGTTLAVLDSTSAQKAVRDARTNLQSAQLALEKLKQPVDTLTLLQAQNSIDQAYQDKEQAQTTIAKAYDDGFAAIAEAFTDLPSVMSNLQKILYGNDLSPTQWNTDYYMSSANEFDSRITKYRDQAIAAYQKSRSSYDANFIAYKGTSRSSDRVAIQALIDQTHYTAQLAGEAIKELNNFILFYKDTVTTNGRKPVAIADTHITTLNTDTNTISQHQSSLLTVRQTIANNTNTATNIVRSIAEKKANLAKLTSGADALDIRSQELAITQRQNALTDALEQLSDYTIRSPIAGIAASVPVQVGDSAGASTVIATMTTAQKLADISLSEVDVARVATGQAATLTFDAIPALTVSGSVAKVDTLATISQGVTTYHVQIVFDTQDQRIKHGMSVSASIIVDVKNDTIIVPLGAVKTQGDVSVVQRVDNVNTAVAEEVDRNRPVALTSAIESVPVQLGLANDTIVEVTGGLTAGDVIVTRVVGQNATAGGSGNANGTFFGFPGVGRGVGGGAGSGGGMMIRRP